MLSGRGRKTSAEKATLLFGALRRYRLALEDGEDKNSDALLKLVQFYVKIYRINNQKAKEYRLVVGFEQAVSGIIRKGYIERCYANDVKAFADDLNRKLDADLKTCFSIINGRKKIGRARIKSRIH